MKILVVDDEPLAREAFIKSLEKMDFKEIYEAKDGIEAYEFILKEMPDIVLCDIRMPLMSGLDLQTRINDINKYIILIFISGHDLFEYAQKALSQGAFDYLLKPVSDDTLKNVLDRACRRLNQQKLLEDKKMLMEIKLDQGLSFMRHRFITELVTHKSLDEAYRESKLNEYGITFPHESLCIIIICIDNFDLITSSITVKDKNLLLFCIENISSEILSGLKVLLYSFEMESGYGFLINYARDSYTASDFYEASLKIRDCINYYLDHKVSIGISTEVRDIDSLPESYEMAQKAVKQKIVKGPNQVHSYKNTSAVNESASIIGIKEEQEMLACLGRCDIDASVKMLENLYSPYRNSEDIVIDKLKKLNLSVILLIYKTVNQIGIRSEEVLGDEFLLYEKVNKCESIDEIIALYEKNIALCGCKIYDLKDSWNNKVLEKAKDFIQTNFSQNITLEDVAEYVHLSPNYFSRIFKQEFGHNFIDYLQLCKINKAKDLIKADKYKINEICKMVGIHDEKHFYRVFKKATGFTPKEFKNT